MKKLSKLDLNITNRCNFRCVHCGYDSGNTKIDELSTGELENILYDSKDLGCECIDIAGGEPSVREDLDEIIKLGKSLDYKVKLNTNGSLLTRERLSYFRDIGLDAVAVSLDGSTYEIYKKIRLVDEKTYSRVLQTIEDSVDLGFYTKVNTVVFNSNLDDLTNIVEYCIENGVKENRICYFMPVGRGSKINELSVRPETWMEYIKEKLTNYPEIKLLVGFPSVIEKEIYERDTKCLLKKDISNLIISPNGNIYPCSILASYFKPIGNLRKTSIKEIWNNEKVWENYYQKISGEVFEKYDSFCVDFSSFNLNEYKSDKYKFVCPLRKFLVGELK